MRFKTFYLLETSSKEYKTLKNIISGAANKEVTSEEKREHGKFFVIPSIGSWTTFANIIKQQLSDLKWEDNSSKSTELVFVNKKQKLCIKLDKGNILAYLTDKLSQEPEWQIEDPAE